MNRQRHIPARQQRAIRRPRWSAKQTTCGKRGYPSLDAAIHAALVASRVFGRAMRVYACPGCGKHHLTPQPKQPNRKDTAA